MMTFLHKKTEIELKESVSRQLFVRFGALNGGEVIDADCGCFACDTNIQPGHFACSVPDALLCQAEKLGYVTRDYDDGAWRWFYIA